MNNTNVYRLKKDTLEYNEGETFAEREANGQIMLVPIGRDGKEINRSTISEAKFESFFEKIEQPKPSIYQPKVGEEYFFIQNDGSVASTTHGGTVSDQGRLSVGNAYQTHEEALGSAEWLKARATILADVRAAHTPNWGDTDNQYWIINLIGDSIGAVEHSTGEEARPQAVAFYGSLEDAAAAIDDQTIAQAYQTYLRGL